MHRDINVTVGGPMTAEYPKVYNTKVLKSGIPFVSQITDTDTKYVIKYNFDLNEERVTIPERCILEFDGGSIDNGTAIGQNTVFINVGDVDIWGELLTREGTWREHSGGGGSGVTPNISMSAEVDANTGTPSVDVTRTGTDRDPHFNLSFHNLKGQDGLDGADGLDGNDGLTPTIDPITKHWKIGSVDTGVKAQGDTGATPAITAGATINGTTGTPSVTVVNSGTAENPIITFIFSNIKGEDGTSVRILPNAESCTNLGDGYVDGNGHLQTLTSLDPRTFTDCGEIKGPAGTTPNISMAATVNNTTGTPSVNVVKTGTNESPLFTLNFSGLKGEHDTVDSNLSNISNNPVKNSVITSTLEKAGALDKAHDSSSFTGLGKVYLTKNIQDVGGVMKNVLIQDMFNKGEVGSRVPNTNTIFVIQYDYTLTGNITIPDNCILQFEGGSFSGSKVIGNNTRINEDVSYNIFNDTEVEGFVFSYLDIRWFGAVPNYVSSSNRGTDNAFAIERAINHIGKYYPGLYMKIVGQYYLGTSITTQYDVNMWGSYCPYNYFHYANITSAPSTLAIGENVSINMTGRQGAVAYFNIKNISVVGMSTANSIFINYSASGAPTRVCVIEECCFRGLYAALVTAAGDTVIGDLTISKCIATACTKFIRADWDGFPNYHSSLCNLVIKDSNIEQNGKRAIEISGAFGSILINNNILEGQEEPICIRCSLGKVTISNNYFESNGGDFFAYVMATNPESALSFTGNYSSVANFKLKCEGIIISECDVLNRLTSGSSFKNCLFKCDYTNFSLDYITDYCHFWPKYGPSNYNDVMTDVDSRGVLVKTVGWNSVLSSSTDKIHNIAFYSANEATYTIGFYASGLNNAISVYTRGFGIITVVRLGLKVTGVTNNLWFGKPSGVNGEKVTAPFFVNSTAEIRVATLKDKIIGKRPTYADLPTGFEVFDTSLSPKKPVYKSGSNWIDAAGNVVS